MNEKDIQLAHMIGAAIEPNGSPAVYLLSSKYTNLVRLNLVLLKAFLDEKRRKGVMVTIDRPHQYVSHLLQLHGVDQSNLRFVDTISTHSSDTKGGPASPGFTGGPFHIETLPDLLFGGPGQGSDQPIDISQVDFVVMDNVSTLLTYNTMESVTKFFVRYQELVSRTSNRKLVTIVAMDRDLHKELHGFISRISRKVIDVGIDMQVKQVGGPGPVLQPEGLSTPAAGDVRQGM